MTMYVSKTLFLFYINESKCLVQKKNLLWVKVNCKKKKKQIKLEY